VVHYDKFVHMYGDELSSLVLVWGSHGWGAQVRRIVGYIPKHMSSSTSENPLPPPPIRDCLTASSGTVLLPHQGLPYSLFRDCFTSSSGTVLLPHQGLFYFLIRGLFYFLIRDCLTPSSGTVLLPHQGLLYSLVRDSLTSTPS
jgi:hypothetical protein